MISSLVLGMLYQPVEQDADVIRDGLSRLRNRIRLLLREDRMICRPPSAATVQASPGLAHAQATSAETKQAGGFYPDITDGSKRVATF